MQKLYYTSHSPIDVVFNKSSRDFVVDEVPLYPFSGEGEHLVLKVRKKDMTTWDLLQKLSEITGVKVREFGYAGLKDKDGLTTQYISIHKKYESLFDNIEDENFKITEKTYHSNKIKIGHLKGNNFFIRLKKVTPVQAQKIDNVLEIINSEGMPNYFGYQRFGRDRDNYTIGREILLGKRNIRSRKKRDFFVSAYQSHIFNLWLSKRVEMSKLFNSFELGELSELFIYSKELLKEVKSQKRFLKLLPGDILHHYPHGKAFECLDVKEEAKRFAAKEVTLTGFLPGHKTKRATNEAGEIEKEFISECEEFIEKMNGSRRFAWIFPEVLEKRYKKEEAWFEFSFFLPKGSYATVLLEELLHKN